MTATKEPEVQHQDTGEMMRLRVARPTKPIYDAQGNLVGGWIFNGYISQRVYLGNETDIPLYRPFRDEEGNHLRNPDGSLKWKKQPVPKWADLVEIVPPPRGWVPLEAEKSTIVSPLAKSSAKKVQSTKSFGRSNRAADANIGE